MAGFARKPESIDCRSAEKDEGSQESSIIPEEPSITMKESAGGQQQKVSRRRPAAGDQQQKVGKKGPKKKNFLGWRSCTSEETEGWQHRWRSQLETFSSITPEELRITMKEFSEGQQQKVSSQTQAKKDQ